MSCWHKLIWENALVYSIGKGLFDVPKKTQVNTLPHYLVSGGNTCYQYLLTCACMCYLHYEDIIGHIKQIKSMLLVGYFLKGWYMNMIMCLFCLPWPNIFFKYRHEFMQLSYWLATRPNVIRLLVYLIYFFVSHLFQVLVKSICCHACAHYKKQ